MIIMKKTKLLLLVLLFTVIPMGLSAYTNGQIVTFDKHTYKVASVAKKELYFVGTDNSNTGELVIPKEVFDKIDFTFTVTGVEYHPLYKCNNITSVKLPETITYLGSQIFGGAKLETINIPKNVVTIEENAWTSVGSVPKCVVDPQNANFSSDNDGALYSKNMSTLYSIPSKVALANGVYTVNDKVTKIIKTGFRLVSGLTKIVFPKNLQEISVGYPTITPTNTITEFAIAGGGSTPFKVIEGVLFKDKELMIYPQAKTTEDYKVPNDITSISSYAFYRPAKLKSIDLNEVTKLTLSSIYEAPQLTSITLPKNIKKYDKTTGEGMVEGCFESCMKVAEYKVPTENTDFTAQDGIIFSKDMQTLYFYPPNKQGTTYNIPASVKTIGRRGFQSAQHLTSMVIPKNIEVMNEEVFRTAVAIETISFEETSKVTKIGHHAFRAIPKLKEVTLPSTLTEINEMFFECKNLETINIPNSSQLKKILRSAFTTNTKLKAFNFQGSCTLEEINENAFANLTELKTFNFPKSVVAIKTNAFSGCSSMAKVDFDPEADILNIGSGAFADCGLKSFDVPKKVKTIEREAFRNCKVLTTINVTETTTKISPEAFKYCSNLTDINVSKKNQVYSSVDGYLLSKNKETLIIFPSGKANDQFTLLPPSIKEIGEYAFYDCKELKNVTIPNKVTTIGKRAFGLCSNLNTITFLCDAMIPAANINQIQSEMSFDNGSQAPDMFRNITINVRKERLADYQAEPFYQKFKLPIGESFIEGTEEYIAVSEKDVDMLGTTRKDYTFILPTEVTHNGKKYNVSLIGDYAFQNATNDIKEVVVKKNVKYIGAKAFMTNINNNTSTVESVFFIESTPTKSMLSTTRFELDETKVNYNEFAATTKIYVKKSALDKYKAAWAKTVYDVATNQDVKSNFDFTSQLDYKIKDVKIAHKYGTFAREFDTDFKDYYNTKGNTDVAAFVAGSKILEKGGDYGESTHHIKMTSVDMNGGNTASYAYVPANTGVLLKVLDKVATDADFYYTIGEEDAQTYNVTNNIMTGVTINPVEVAASATAPVYVMQGGVFRKVTSPIPSSKFPIHRAYVKLSSLPANAKVVFDFEDSNITGIESITTSDDANNNAYYNLNGQRINKPQQGIYIHKGKKIVIR